MRTSQGASGQTVVEWDRKDLGGRRSPAGVYFARLDAGTSQAGVKLVLE